MRGVSARVYSVPVVLTDRFLFEFNWPITESSIVDVFYAGVSSASEVYSSVALLPPNSTAYGAALRKVQGMYVIKLRGRYVDPPYSGLAKSSKAPLERKLPCYVVYGEYDPSRLGEGEMAELTNVDSHREAGYSYISFKYGKPINNHEASLAAMAWCMDAARLDYNRFAWISVSSNNSLYIFAAPIGGSWACAAKHQSEEGGGSIEARCVADGFYGLIDMVSDIPIDAMHYIADFFDAAGGHTAAEQVREVSVMSIL